MSANDMLAAQLWPWPDPIIKRNAHGGIIFVNAAFLQIYGGQVTDWHGCAIEGWPAPVPGQAENRFETRIPSASGEIIYDWLEYNMPDGGAMAISRNVTALLIQTPPTDPALAHMPPMQQEPEQAQYTGQDLSDMLPIHTPTEPQMAAAVAPAIEPYVPEQQQIAAPDPAIQPATVSSVQAVNPVQSAPMAQAPVNQAPVNQAPVNQAPVNQAPVNQAPVNQAPVNQAPVNQAPVQMTIPTEEPVSVDIPVEPVIVPPVETQVSAQNNERDFERRALPIENEENLLGSNWRDAVIAKAVGAEALEGAQAEAQQTQTPHMEAINPNDAMAAPESELIANPNDTDNAIRILLAEDNAINALLTRTLLEADGYYVEVVEDGSLAVDAVRNNQYDMILMDMRMPNMDGLEATRKIRGLSNEAKATPIIALTANAFDDDRNACFDAGMNDFMTKPVSAEELQQMVRTWTKSKEDIAA